MDVDCVGAIKLQDGLFLGDQYAGHVLSTQDLEFLVANKVTHIVNCAGRDLPNHWEAIGVRYLSLQWLDCEQGVALDEFCREIQTIYDFIQSSTQFSESALLLSQNGTGRCVLLATAYFMMHFRWSVSKALEFVRFRLPLARLNSGFLGVLEGLEAYLAQTDKAATTHTWSELTTFSEEELVVTNTFLNAQSAGRADYVSPVPGTKVTRLRWADGEEEGGKLEQGKGRERQAGVFVHQPSKSCLKGSLRPPISTARPQKVLGSHNSSIRASADPPSAPPKPERPNSTKRPASSKRENSPLFGAHRTASAKKESPRMPANDSKKGVQGKKTQKLLGVTDMPHSNSSLSLSRPSRPHGTPQRVRPSSECKASVPSASTAKRAVWK